MSRISPGLQAAVTRALTNSRRTQAETGKDVLSRADTKRIIDAASADGISPDEVKLIVDQVGQALRDDKLDLSTSRRQKQIEKLFDTLAKHQPIPVEGASAPPGSFSWLNLLTAEKSGGATTPEKPAAPPVVDNPDITVMGGIAAYERVANILLKSRVKVPGGGDSIASLELALEKATPDQHATLTAFHTDLVNRGKPLNRLNIIAGLEARIAEMRTADVDGNQALSPEERTLLGNVGQLAAGLAQALDKKEPVAAAAAHVFGGLSGEALQEKIRDVAAAHRELDYSYARTILFSELHNEAGNVEDFYTDRSITTTGTPRNRVVQRMNTEHLFPKSHGVKELAALSDLHHLFPTDDETNAMRASHPFGHVVGKPEFQKDDSKLGTDASGNTVFEPPEETKGAIARALMYISTVYQLDIDDVGGKALMQQWSAAHPPSPEEIARNAAISKHQGNRNPFIDLPSLMDRV